MRDEVMLNRQLHTFEVGELKELRRISENIFEPLMRPFRQKRMVQTFSFDKSIRTAQRLGVLMPTYEKIARTHRKSRLVIAMSLAGIDRCSAVSLIPLLSCLKETALDFNLYVYTDDLIKAEFTHDGFLANDYKIAWNHVSGPNVMERLSQIETTSQEDILLIIDSLGGGASRWYEYWGYEHREAVRDEQKTYLKTAGKYGCYSRIRRELGGDYSKIKSVKIPAEYYDKVKSNTSSRWMHTPAMEEYMVRWCFHPDFGSVTHGEMYVPYRSAFEIMRNLKGKFRQIHLLTPNNQGAHRTTLDKLLSHNVVDYHHQANTIYGFATVLSDIVHGQCPFDGPFTKKVSYEIVKFSEFKGEEDAEEDGRQGDENHTNLKPSGHCFDSCRPLEKFLPEEHTVKLDKRVRSSNSVVVQELPINEVVLEDLLPADMALNQFWKGKILPYDFEIEKGDSEYTRLRKAEDVLDVLNEYHIVFRAGYGFNGLVREKRPASYDAQTLDAVLKGVEYDRHRTDGLRDDVEEYLMMLAPAYHKYFGELPLKNVIWCDVSKFSRERMSISVDPKQSLTARKESAWHELGHYLEAVCPPVGAFSNEMLRRKGGKFDRKKLVQVGSGGEWGMPVTDGSKDWITPYAGKWYKRVHQNLPNDTEIVSVHSEYFSKKEKLVRLIRHDPDMVRFMAFVFMGGPVAAMSALRELRRKDVLQEVSQRSRGSTGYTGGRGGGRGSRGGSVGKTNHGFGF